MQKKFLICILGLMIAVGQPTAISFAAETYTKVDIDSWDYDRTESLQNQISVQGDVEYVPPDDLKTAEDLHVDYSNQEEETDNSKEKEKADNKNTINEQETVAQPQQSTKDNMPTGIMLFDCAAIVSIIAALLFKKFKK